MLSVVKCPACGQAFQVETIAVGKQVACPFCQAIVTATIAPIAMPVARPIEPGTPEAPLSLDDAEPLPPVTPSPAQPASAFRQGLKLGLVLLLTLLSMGTVYFLFQYGSGNLPNYVWHEIVPEGGRCRILMPGAPSEETMPSAGRGSDGKRLSVVRWFEKVYTTFGWFDLAENAMPFTTVDGLAKRHAEELAQQHNGTIIESGVLRFGGYDGREFVLDTDKGRWIERIILVPSKPRPRVFVLGIGGPKLTKDSEAVTRFFNSLRLEIPRE